MATMTLSVSDDMKEWIEEEVGDEFADASKYLQDLVERDKVEMRRIVAEAEESGIGDRTLDEIFEGAVERARTQGTPGDSFSALATGANGPGGDIRSRGSTFRLEAASWYRDGLRKAIGMLADHQQMGRIALSARPEIRRHEQDDT